MAMTRLNFNDKPQAKKGAVGERIVKTFLESKGFCCYLPATEGAHAFDFLAIKDKKQCIALDVKSKARRNYYADTGIDIRHFNTYKDFAVRHNMRFFLCFIDEMIGKAYGNWLHLLQEEKEVGGKRYPSLEYQIIYFPLASMRLVKILNDSEINELKNYSTRTHDYIYENRNDKNG